MTLNSLLDQILNQSNDMDELDDISAENEEFEDDSDNQISQELILNFQKKLQDLSRRAQQGGNSDELYELHQDLLREMNKYAEILEDDQKVAYSDITDVMEPLINPETFQDFIGYYQNDCLAAIKNKQSVFDAIQEESFSLYVNFNEVLPCATQGRKSAKAVQTSGLTLGFVLVNTAQTETLGVIAGALQEYPQTLSGNVDIPVSQSVKKEIREQLWKTTLGDLNKVNKKPRVHYHFVFDPIDIADLMFRGITAGKNVGILRIDNSDDKLAEKFPMVKNVKRFLENNKAAGSSFITPWNQGDFDKHGFISNYLLLDSQNALTCPPLNLRVDYGPLPAFDSLFSADTDAPLELTVETKPAAKAKAQSDKAGKKTPAQDAPSLYYVRIRKINSVPEEVPDINLTFCVNRPVTTNAQARQIVRSGAFHWINEQFQIALDESQKLPTRYALGMDGQMRLGFFYTSIPHIQQILIHALLSPFDSPAEIELGSTIAALDNVLLNQKKTYSLETYRDFYLSMAKAGGFKDGKPNSVPSWKEIWKGWGLLTDKIQDIVEMMEECRQ